MSDDSMNDSTFGRLFIIMIIAMTVLTVIIMILASLAARGVNDRLDERSAIENSQAIIDRLSPVGNFSTETTVAVVADPAILSGSEAYASCGACHGAGIAGAPALGDKSAWADRLSKSLDELYSNAINGYQGSAGYMPARGGNAALSDGSVKAAVDYMLDSVR